MVSQAQCMQYWKYFKFYIRSSVHMCMYKCLRMWVCKCKFLCMHEYACVHAAPLARVSVHECSIKCAHMRVFVFVCASVSVRFTVVCPTLSNSLAAIFHEHLNTCRLFVLSRKYTCQPTDDVAACGGTQGVRWQTVALHRSVRLEFHKRTTGASVRACECANMQMCTNVRICACPYSSILSILAENLIIEKNTCTKQFTAENTKKKKHSNSTKRWESKTS